MATIFQIRQDPAVVRSYSYTPTSGTANAITYDGRTFWVGLSNGSIDNIKIDGGTVRIIRNYTTTALTDVAGLAYLGGDRFYATGRSGGSSATAILKRDTSTMDTLNVSLGSGLIIHRAVDYNGRDLTLMVGGLSANVIFVRPGDEDTSVLVTVFQYGRGICFNGRDYWISFDLGGTNKIFALYRPNGTASTSVNLGGLAGVSGTITSCCIDHDIERQIWGKHIYQLSN